MSTGPSNRREGRITPAIASILCLASLRSATLPLDRILLMLMVLSTGYKSSQCTVCSYWRTCERGANSIRSQAAEKLSLLASPVIPIFTLKWNVRQAMPSVRCSCGTAGSCATIDCCPVLLELQ